MFTSCRGAFKVCFHPPSMSVLWFLLGILGLAAGRGTGGGPDFSGGGMMTVVTWAVQAITEPLLGEQARQQSQLNDVAGRLDRLAAMVSNLTDIRLEQQSSMDSQQDQLDKLDNRLERLEQQLLWSGGASNQSDVGRSSSASQSSSLSRDCSDLPKGSKSGIHLLRPGLGRSGPPIPSFCDLETDGGGWTVFQRRVDIQPRIDFFLGWQAYKDGFGELDMEFWWGLENLFQSTSSKDRRYELRIELEDYELEKRFALYQGFRISSEGDGYRLQAANYSGDAGDSLSEHFGMKFSTHDKDQDKYHINCARSRKGAWWYNRCFHSNLNGRHFEGEFRRGLHGTTWKTWRGGYYSLKMTEMKFRPTLKTVGD